MAHSLPEHAAVRQHVDLFVNKCSVVRHKIICHIAYRLVNTLLRPSIKIHSSKPKTHPPEASLRPVFGLNERISLDGL